MKRNILLSLFLLAISYYNAHGQLFAGAVFGMSPSKSFKHYAEYINQQPGVINKLGNFYFTSGFSCGIEVPNAIVPGGAFAFNYRQLEAGTKMTYQNLGDVRYELKQKQFLMPMSFGEYDTPDRGVIRGVGGTVIIGMSKTAIHKSFENTSFSAGNRTFTANQMNFGLGITGIYTFKYLGFYSKLTWMGSLLPVRSLKFEMFDRSFYSTDTFDMDSYYLQYVKNEEVRNVRADFRGVLFEAGVFLWLF